MHFSISLPQSTRLTRLCSLRGWPRFGLRPVSSAVAGDNAAAELSQSVPTQALGRWRVTGSLATARESHGDVAAERAGAGGRWVGDGSPVRLLSERGTIRSGDWDVDGDRQPRRCTGRHTATLLPNGQVLVAGGHRQRQPLSKRGTIRSSDWGVDGDRQHGHCTLSDTRRRCCRTGRCWWPAATATAVAS